MHAAVLVVVVVAAASVRAGTPSAAAYPALDKVPPVNNQWSSAFIKNVPDLKVNSAQLPSPDWSADVTTCVGQKTWGLSYDDGPGPYTDDLLAQLKKRGVTATFFVIGSRVLERPDVLQRVYAAGHQIGIHTWSHPALTTISNDQVVAEIVYTARIIKETIGVTPKYMRPPYGDIDNRVRAILKNMGLIVVDWNVDSGDAEGATNVASQFTSYAASNSGPVISLEHDLFPKTEPQAAPALDGILAGGYKVVPVKDCVGTAPYNESFWKSLSITFPTTTATQATTTSSSTTQASSSTTTTTSSSTTAASTSAASTTSAAPLPRPSSNAAAALSAVSVASLASIFAIMFVL
ncbi:chitin deacetylase [Polyrhizophydium stewartii]|uniref:Chitin deacetylase n=1 Tax=Polyrhizophydium stewartii TaxID=2732419 RepID=A0ABR4NFU7_9FUNG